MPLFTLRPRAWLRFSFSVIFFLVAAHLVVQYFKYYLGYPTLLGFSSLFDMDLESNIPSWYSSVMLLVAATLVFLISAEKQFTQDRYLGHWRALSFLFLFFSMDEAVSIHEKGMALIRRGIQTTGIFYFSWVYLGLALVALFVVFYLPFIKNLPNRLRFLFMVAGLVYVVGALGMEMVAGNYIFNGGTYAMAYQVMVAVEEALEMAGVALFIYASMVYMQTMPGNETRWGIRF